MAEKKQSKQVTAQRRARDRRARRHGAGQGKCSQQPRAHKSAEFGVIPWTQ